MSADIANWIAAVAAVGSVGVASFALVIARSQLGGLRDELRLNRLQVVLEIENQMNSRKLEFDRASRAIRENAEVPDSQFSILEDWYNVMKENYFNALDRLAYCILKKYLEERDWKAEYRNLFAETVKNFEADFGEASPFRNIIKLNRKWQDE